MNYLKLSLFAGVGLILIVVAGHAADRKKEPLSKPKAVPVVVEKKPAIEMTQTKPATGEEINWHVISCGGTGGDSPSYGHVGTTGQTAVGMGKSQNYRLSSGFWPDFSPSSCCVGLTGNVDGDPADMVDLGDLTKLIDYLFISFTPPDCMEEANCDGSIDGIVDLGDLTTLIDYLFISFTPPAPCQ